MARKEQKNNRDRQGTERNWQLWEEGYSTLEFAEEFSRSGLDRNIERTKTLIYAYCFGDRFLHYEAYMLCGVGNFWPDFCYHPDEPNYVLKFEDLNSTETEREEHIAFELWVDENRKEIAMRAADGMGIDWSEIESI